MTRAWGIKYEDVLYHAFSRGNERQDIVINDDDRRLFFKCDMDYCRESTRISKSAKSGLTYSAASQRVGLIRNMLNKDK